MATSITFLLRRSHADKSVISGERTPAQNWIYSPFAAKRAWDLKSSDQSRRKSNRPCEAPSPIWASPVWTSSMPATALTQWRKPSEPSPLRKFSPKSHRWTLLKDRPQELLARGAAVPRPIPTAIRCPSGRCTVSTEGAFGRLRRRSRFQVQGPKVAVSVCLSSACPASCPALRSDAGSL